MLDANCEADVATIRNHALLRLAQKLRQLGDVHRDPPGRIDAGRGLKLNRTVQKAGEG